MAVALCRSGDAAPELVQPGHIWSRQDVLDWLAGDLPEDTLVGLDLGISLPFVDEGAFFPGWSESPRDAPALWALVDRLCADDPYLAASSFVDHVEAARHFRRHGGRKGDLFTGRGRLRATEHAQARAGLRPYSNLNLVGAAQVGKSSLTGMRVLHRLAGRVPVWPFEECESGSVIVEIYTSLAALAGGRSVGRTKMKTGTELDAALRHIGSVPTGLSGAIDDHKSDAILTAAWLRSVADRPELWHPSGMTPEIARTEGWTFGIA
ncbi:hypothetical protein Q5H94_10855 [Sphingomonas sp. CA1-15]|uniref:DUF429 domain-containing protein n=1 Tax=Sphingomonas immobilis TaxID=3063997 RepID=A0ABT8ZZ25_9SPHN|nr:hypothetical protein [Sphingomonas sp. CA1-15]MDO7842829.1 hypothetical protein [Sphingomonas sp. CA1-15]